MVPSESDPLPPRPFARRLLGALRPGERVAGYLFAAYFLALVTALFVAPVALAVGLDVGTFRAVELTILAVGVGYVAGMAVLWVD
jgi:hypothetical protein